MVRAMSWERIAMITPCTRRSSFQCEHNHMAIIILYILRQFAQNFESRLLLFLLLSLSPLPSFPSPLSPSCFFLLLLPSSPFSVLPFPLLSPFCSPPFPSLSPPFSFPLFAPLPSLPCPL